MKDFFFNQSKKCPPLWLIYLKFDNLLAISNLLMYNFISSDKPMDNSGSFLHLLYDCF